MYKGKLKPWALLAVVFTLNFTGLAIWLGYRFFTAQTSEQLIQYGVGLIICVIFVQALKLWHWMQMDKNALIREIKRLEYQIAVLAEKVSDRD